MTLLTEMEQYLKDKDLSRFYYEGTDEDYLKIKNSINPLTLSKKCVELFLTTDFTSDKFGIPISTLSLLGMERVSLSTREKILSIYKDALTFSTLPDDYFYLFFDFNAYPIKKRLQVLTKNLDVEKLIFITKEKEREIVFSYQAITLLLIEKALGFNVENIEEKIFSKLCTIFSCKGSSYSFDTSVVSKFLSERNLRKFQSSPLLKVMLFESYKTSESSFYETRNVFSVTARDYFYLIGESGAKKQYAFKEEFYKHGFLKISTSLPSSHSLERVITMKEDLESFKKEMDTYFKK